MNIEDIKKNITREDLMIASVKTGFAPSTIYSLLNGTRALNEGHTQLLELLSALASDNVNFYHMKLDLYELQEFQLKRA